ncbi:MAG: ABC transporter ATP-binding protein [Verrucomicrobiota bacterium]
MSEEKEKAVLKCHNLERYLGKYESRTRVLKGVSMEAHPQTSYAIVGPSGCGKSSLLYLLGLLDTPDAGKIWIGGRETTGMNEKETTGLRNERLGFVFQFHFLIKEFTALENVMLPMKKLGKLNDRDMRERALHLLEEVGLFEKADRFTNHLSGGEQQRVAIARALANQPRVMLADEPTGNLDSKNSDRIFALLTRVIREEELALVMVTHNPEIAEQCDTILQMEDGDIVRRQENLRGKLEVDLEAESYNSSLMSEDA